MNRGAQGLLGHGTTLWDAVMMDPCCCTSDVEQRLWVAALGHSKGSAEAEADDEEVGGEVYTAHFC